MSNATTAMVMPEMSDFLSWHNPVFRQYGFWTAILVIKMAIMSLITVYQRFRTKTWVSSEEGDSEPKVLNEKVERVRRAHLNDLENVVPYILISFVYTMAAPYPIVAINLFRIAAGARILHTIFYAIFPVRQPVRGILFAIPLLIMLYMCIQCAIFFLLIQ